MFANQFSFRGPMTPLSPIQLILIALTRASAATQEAHDALEAHGLHEEAVLLRTHGEAISIAMGSVVIGEARKRKAAQP